MIKNPIKIICEKHGIFKQIANTHLRGSGCPKCVVYGGINKKTTEQFIIDAKLMHGNKYDYSLVEYINSQTNVNIVCIEHGSFNQIPSLHLRGSGCPKCASELPNH